MQTIFLLWFLIFQANHALSSKRNLEESPDDIIIVHLNDVHCGVDEKIGYDGFVLYLDELKKNYSNIIAVDVGDHIQGGTMGSISEGDAIIKILNRVGFDVVILGNHEFDYGIEQLSKLEKEITSKYICSNFCYKKNKTSVFPPYKIIEKGGKKIAFIGVLTPLTFSQTYLSSTRDSNGDVIYDFLADNNGQELFDRVQKNINEARDEGADYVILLTHIGMSIEEYTSEELLSKLENVNAVLDGHTHKIYNTTSKDKNNMDIHISQTGTKLESIGKLIIKNDGTISSEMIAKVPEPSNKTNAIKLTRNKNEVWVNKDMNNFINDIWSEYQDELNLVYGYNDYDLTIWPEGSTASNENYCRIQECTVGNLAADAFKHVGNAEISLVNGGTVRSNLKRGNLTRAKIMEVTPFFNNVIVKRVPGQCVLDALEFGVSKHPKPSGGFPQVSGISYDIITTLNSSVESDSQELFINITGKRKVSNVKINGQDLDPRKNYTLSMSEYIAKGGDGYTMFSKYEVFNESLLTDTDALAYYIHYVLNGTIPAQYKDFQGRINFVNGTIDPSPSNDSNFLRYNARKNSGGLSAGSIIAIIIPLAAALIAVTILAIICANKNGLNQPISQLSGSNFRMKA